ncbi:hypothetical protein BDZ89DRAFT_1203777 [Hymenopellis radicata]|nr:hypothetical protein BDZ89DRAFT_1203777 [Hymenopellis radicata]
MLSVPELETRVQDTISFENINGWVNKYSMREKLRCHPEYFATLTSREETCNLFNAYVGAVFTEQGLSAVKNWVESLLGMEPSRKIKSLPTTSPQVRFERSIPQHMTFSPPPPPPANVPQMAPMRSPPPPPPLSAGPSFQPDAYHGPPPPPLQPMRTMAPPPPPPLMFQQARSSFQQPPTPTFQPSFQPSPVPAPNAFLMNKSPPQQGSKHTLPPPPYQAKLSTPNPMAPAQPGLAFLPLFNQTASQRRVNVEYKADFSGPPHAGKWTVTCVVNGISKGTGSGGNKQIAKEEAARAAYYSMGWS